MNINAKLLNFFTYWYYLLKPQKLDPSSNAVTLLLYTSSQQTCHFILDYNFCVFLGEFLHFLHQWQQEKFMDNVTLSTPLSKNL